MTDWRSYFATPPVLLLLTSRAGAVEVSLTPSSLSWYFGFLETYVFPFILAASIALLLGYGISRLFERSESQKTFARLPESDADAENEAPDWQTPVLHVPEPSPDLVAPKRDEPVGPVLADGSGHGARAGNPDGGAVSPDAASSAGSKLSAAALVNRIRARAADQAVAGNAPFDPEKLEAALAPAVKTEVLLQRIAAEATAQEAGNRDRGSAGQSDRPSVESAEEDALSPAERLDALLARIGARPSEPATEAEQRETDTRAGAADADRSSAARLDSLIERIGARASGQPADDADGAEARAGSDGDLSPSEKLDALIRGIGTTTPPDASDGDDQATDDAETPSPVTPEIESSDADAVFDDAVAEPDDDLLEPTIASLDDSPVEDRLEMEIEPSLDTAMDAPIDVESEPWLEPGMGEPVEIDPMLADEPAQDAPIDVEPEPADEPIADASVDRTPIQPVEPAMEPPIDVMPEAAEEPEAFDESVAAMPVDGEMDEPVQPMAGVPDEFASEPAAAAPDADMPVEPVSEVPIEVPPEPADEHVMASLAEAERMPGDAPSSPDDRHADIPHGRDEALSQPDSDTGEPIRDVAGSASQAAADASYDPGAGRADDADVPIPSAEIVEPISAIDISPDPDAAMRMAGRVAGHFDEAVAALDRIRAIVDGYEAAREGLDLEAIGGMRVAGIEIPDGADSVLLRLGEDASESAVAGYDEIGRFNHVVDRLAEMAQNQPLDEGWNELLQDRIVAAAHSLSLVGNRLRRIASGEPPPEAAADAKSPGHDLRQNAAGDPPGWSVGGE